MRATRESPLGIHGSPLSHGTLSNALAYLLQAALLRQGGCGTEGGAKIAPKQSLRVAQCSA